MVQVDVFWSYAIGAGFALAATHQISRAKPRPTDSGASRWQQWNSPYFLVTALYCALLFVPSGVYLLWAFPDWETMQVARDHSSIPAWLVTAFVITNVTQALIGYEVGRRLIRAGHRYAALVQVGVAYFGMFFILVHGWDGRGYHRFFSADRATFESWPPDSTTSETLDRIGQWLTSPVALTLACMSVIVVVLLWIMSDWLKEGHRMAAASRPPSALAIVGLVLGFILGLALGSAILASVVIHILGWWIGIPVAAALIWLAVLWPRTGLGYRVYRRLQLTDQTAPQPQQVAAAV